MKCPYCAEDLNDEAQVCRHCGREFMLLKPLQEQISSLEQQISESKQDATAAQPINLARILWMVLLAAVVPVATRSTVSAMGYSGLQGYWLYGAGSATQLSLLIRDLITILDLITLGSPWFFGLWAARAWPGRHLMGYIPLALFVGFLAMPLQIGVDALLQIHYHSKFNQLAPSMLVYLDHVVWGWAFTAFSVTPAMLFLSGALYGDFRKPSVPGSGFAWKISNLVARLPFVSTGERFVEFLRLSAPIVAALIGLVATLIRLYITLNGSQSG